MRGRRALPPAVVAAGLLLFAADGVAGVDPCALLKGEEVSKIVGGRMAGRPSGNMCYFLDGQREVTVLVLDKAEYDLQKGFALGGIGQKLGWKSVPVAGIGPETLEWPADKTTFNLLFQKGSVGARVDVKGAADPRAAAEALGKLVAQRLP